MSNTDLALSFYSINEYFIFATNKLQMRGIHKKYDKLCHIKGLNMLDATNTHETELVERLKKRDNEAISAVIKQNHKQLCNVARRHRLNEEMVDEVVAETWRVFFEKIENFEGRSKVKTYVFGILMNKIKEEKRKNSRVDLLDDPHQLLESNFDKNGFWTYEPIEPDRLLEIQETQEAFKNCLENLSDRQKQAYELKVSEDLEYKEISSILGINLTNLKVSVHRARNQIRRCLEAKVA